MRVKTPYVKFKPKELKDATWRVIIDAWTNRSSDREISFLLSKDRSTDHLGVKEIHALYANNADIADLKAMLNMGIIVASRQTVADAVAEGDVKTAKWVLEHMAQDEFSTRQSVAFDGAVIELSIEDKEKKLKELVEKYEKGE